LLDALEQHTEPAHLATEFTSFTAPLRLRPSAGAELGVLFEHWGRRRLECGLADQGMLKRLFERLQDDISPFLRSTRKHVVERQGTVCRTCGDKLREFLR
jgi:hypothetical protein